MQRKQPQQQRITTHRRTTYTHRPSTGTTQDHRGKRSGEKQGHKTAKVGKTTPPTTSPPNWTLMTRSAHRRHTTSIDTMWQLRTGLNNNHPALNDVSNDTTMMTSSTTTALNDDFSTLSSGPHNNTQQHVPYRRRHPQPNNDACRPNATRR